MTQVCVTLACRRSGEAKAPVAVAIETKGETKIIERDEIEHSADDPHSA